MNLFVDILGWAGAVLLLLPYFLISRGYLSVKSAKYQSMNVTGGVLLTCNSAYYMALPSVFVNVIWIIIGLYSLRRLGLHTAKGIGKWERE